MTPQRYTSGRTLRWALGLSLALNLLVIGAIGGAGWRHAQGGPMGSNAPGLRSYASPYVQALPKSDRRALHTGMRNGDNAKHLSRDARRALYARMLTALRADPFDAAEAQAVLTAQSQAVMTVQADAHAAWLVQVGAMNAAARADYADALEARLSRGKRHGDKRNP